MKRLKIWRAPMDGSCFFHSVGHFLDPPMSAQQVRTLCASLIWKRQNEDFEGLLLKDWIHFETNESVWSYMKGIARPNGTWGGFLEMKLLSDYFKRSILVFMYETSHNDKKIVECISEVNPSGAAICSIRPLYLLYKHGLHYDALYEP
jgi:hypothetical protein